MLEEEGLLIIPMSSDGNCLFRALSDQLLGDRGKQHEIIRAEICDFMEENEEEFNLFMVFEDDEGNNSEDAADFDSYMGSMRQDGTWGGNLELVAAARLYRRNIIVYSATLSAITISHNRETSTGPDLLVSFHSGDHYNSVRSKHSPPPKKSVSHSSSERRASRHQSSRRSSQRSSRSCTSETSSTSATAPTRLSLGDTLASSASTLSTADETSSAISKHESQEIPLARVVGIDDKPVKPSAPCPCGSRRRYKRCCAPKVKDESKRQRDKERRISNVEEMRDDTPSEPIVTSKFRMLQI
eukprot:scaffold834_cov123-Cylindrotheca_fusiformis.AAC.4